MPALTIVQLQTNRDFPRRKLRTSSNTSANELIHGLQFYKNTRKTLPNVKLQNLHAQVSRTIATMSSHNLCRLCSTMKTKTNVIGVGQNVKLSRAHGSILFTQSLSLLYSERQCTRYLIHIPTSRSSIVTTASAQTE